MQVRDSPSYRIGARLEYPQSATARRAVRYSGFRRSWAGRKRMWPGCVAYLAARGDVVSVWTTAARSS